MKLSAWYRCICCIRHTREIFGQEFDDLDQVMDINDYEVDGTGAVLRRPTIVAVKRQPALKEGNDNTFLGTDSGSFEDSARGMKGIDIIRDT